MYLERRASSKRISIERLDRLETIVAALAVTQQSHTADIELLKEITSKQDKVLKADQKFPYTNILGVTKDLLNDFWGNTPTTYARKISKHIFPSKELETHRKADQDGPDRSNQTDRQPFTTEADLERCRTLFGKFLSNRKYAIQKVIFNKFLVAVETKYAHMNMDQTILRNSIRESVNAIGKPSQVSKR